MQKHQPPAQQLLATHTADLGHMHSSSQLFALLVLAIHAAVDFLPFIITYAQCIIDIAGSMSMSQIGHALQAGDGGVPQILHWAACVQDSVTYRDGYFLQILEIVVRAQSTEEPSLYLSTIIIQ
jgi:hypothetical protein